VVNYSLINLTPLGTNGSHSNSFSAVNLDEISVSGQTIQTNHGKLNGIMDTGTTLMIAPRAVADVGHFS
jgi:Eukaryotic aspartyl protease